MDYIYDWNLIDTNDAHLAHSHIYDWNLIKMNHQSLSFSQAQAKYQSLEE